MKLKRKHYKYFKKRCEFWHKIFGVTELMVVDFETAPKTTMAFARNDDQNHTVYIRLNKDYKYQFDENIYDFLDSTSCHEVYEGTVLGPLHNLATEIYSHNYVSSISHKAVNQMIKNIYPILRKVKI